MARPFPVCFDKGRVSLSAIEDERKKGGRGVGDEEKTNRRAGDNGRTIPILAQRSPIFLAA
jgi:hypothetical protein